jgi:hypothetical protein
MFEELAKVLFGYGLAGAVCLAMMLGTIKIYRDSAKDRERHARELHELEERYIAKSETWMLKYHELGQSMAAFQTSMKSLLESLITMRAKESRNE